ncbi:transmembrane emp24 domain-containing protein 1 [Clupea harengus]|uniref:Transmembrane emp24 domain-containing protein 1 n=1 Tax=Clupea harengus TaxID=7950 RepID=A0A6P3WCJ6_CLUHA|nr:transmembrane emp24 domain-containing protein 1 [Clupea harengus]
MDSLLRLCMVSFFVSFVDVVLTFRKNQDVEFTFVLPAGATECFYQTITDQNSMEVEYQILAGSSLEVGFTLISPSGYRLVSDFRKSDGIHTVEPVEMGDYSVCFDNSFSKFSEKMVFVGLILNGPAGREPLGDGDWEKTPESDIMLEYKLMDIMEKMETVHQHLEGSRQAQAALRMFEARDRYLLEDNLWRVSFWSCANLLVMLAVALVQVYTLRRLFDNKRLRA